MSYQQKKLKIKKLSAKKVLQELQLKLTKVKRVNSYKPK